MNQGMVVAPQPEAVEAGVLILREGGNAVDAGIACGLFQGVVDPQMTGIAGFGSLQAYLPENKVHSCIDFHGNAPAAIETEYVGGSHQRRNQRWVWFHPKKQSQ